MKKTVVLVCFAVVMAAAVLVATERARSLGIDDTTPPVGHVSLPAVVHSVHVDVVVAVADQESGVVELRLSNDGVTWSAWQGFPSPSPSGSFSVRWQLSAGAGEKTVTVEVRNGSGLTTSFATETVLRPATAAAAGVTATTARPT